MSTRREFLANAVGLAGVCFVGCSLLGPHRAHAQTRRTVKLGGKFFTPAVAKGVTEQGIVLVEGELEDQPWRQQEDDGKRLGHKRP